jgi:hypothetical protein
MNSKVQNDKVYARFLEIKVEQQDTVESKQIVRVYFKSDSYRMSQASFRRSPHPLKGATVLKFDIPL